MNKKNSSIIKLTIDGETFDVTSRDNYVFDKNPYKSEFIATSGKDIEKKIKKIRNVYTEISTTTDDLRFISELEQTKKEVRLSVLLGDDSIFYCVGIIEKFTPINDLRGLILLTPCSDWLEFNP